MAYDDGYGQQQMQMAFPPFRGWLKKLVIINGAIFLATFFLGFISTSFQRSVLDWFHLAPIEWGNGLPPLWQAVSYGFLHSVTSLSHIFYNMLLLYMFGEMVQSAVGDRRFVTHYVIALIVGALVHLLLSTVSVKFSTPVVGASGAVMAMVAAAATLRPHGSVIFIIVPVKLWFLAAALVAFDVFGLLSELQNGYGDGIAHTVHLGGAAYGFLAVKRRWLYADPLAALERKRAVRRMQRTMSDYAKMDELMAKISRAGMPSLTRSERTFMQRQSERRRPK